jgi:hypothetical protein
VKGLKLKSKCRGEIFFALFYISMPTLSATTFAKGEEREMGSIIGKYFGDVEKLLS